MLDQQTFFIEVAQSWIRSLVMVATNVPNWVLALHRVRCKEIVHNICIISLTLSIKLTVFVAENRWLIFGYYFSLQKIIHSILKECTICPRSSYTFYIETYCIKWVTTSWAQSIFSLILRQWFFLIIVFIKMLIKKTSKIMFKICLYILLEDL